MKWDKIMAFDKRGFLKGLGEAAAAIIPFKTAKMSAGEIAPDLDGVEFKHLTMNDKGEFVYGDYYNEN